MAISRIELQLSDRHKQELLMPQNRTLSKVRRNLLRGGVWALFGLLLAGGFSVANIGVAEAPREAAAARVAYSGGPAEIGRAHV